MRFFGLHNKVGLKILKTNPVLFLHAIIVQMSTCEVVSVESCKIATCQMNLKVFH